MISATSVVSASSVISATSVVSVSSVISATSVVSAVPSASVHCDPQPSVHTLRTKAADHPAVGG